jgi:hypothetical protein
MSQWNWCNNNHQLTAKVVRGWSNDPHVQKSVGSAKIIQVFSISRGTGG